MAIIRFPRDAEGIIVPATIVGPASERTVIAALDTGASLCVFPPQVTWAAGITSGPGARHVSMTTASGVLHVPVVTVPAVRMGGLMVRDVDAALHELPPSAGIDGLLGLSFLRGFRISIDFQKGILRLTR